MLENGAGSELRKPLGYAMVGGLLLSQVLTLYTTPVIYLYLDRLQHWLAPRRHARLPRLAEKLGEASGGLRHIPMQCLHGCRHWHRAIARHLTFEQGNGRMRLIVAMFVSTVAAAPAMAANGCARCGLTQRH